MGPLELKEEGNRLVKERRWRDAIEQYTKGLEACGEEAPDLRGLLLSNRSQCWLSLEEWLKALGDADACLRILPEHTKSLFRRAAAHERLGHAEEALADYAKVARVEPQNRAAAEAAARLREVVMKASARRQEEVLPAHLLEQLRAGSLEERTDACAKLRALCVHRGLAGSLLGAGALELLVGAAAEAEAVEALLEAALAALVALASGHEAADDLDDGAARARAAGATPASAAQARQRLRASLPLDQLRRGCRGQARSTRQLALLIGFAFEPEDAEALEALHDALAFVEGAGVDVPRAGVVALATMCDARRRQGRRGRALVPSRPLLKCLETALGAAPSCAEPLRSLLASVFVLLADTDRPQGTEVDLPDLGQRILEPFLQSPDFGLKANGLIGLAALLAANVQVATQVLQRSPAPFTAILSALQRPPPGTEGRLAQDSAAECLLLATGDRKTREHLINSQGIDIMLGTLADGEAGGSSSSSGGQGAVRAKIVAVLAIIAGHNKEIREEIFDRMDFLVELRHAFETAREALGAAREGAAGTGLEDARRLCRGLYESCACLSLHGEFKEGLAGSKGALRAVQGLASAEDLAADPQLAFFYASLVHNLCRSREDRERSKKDKDSRLGELNEEDLKAVEEMYEKMPAESRPVKNGEIDHGSVEVAQQLRSWCVLQSAEARPAAVGDASAPPCPPAVAAQLGRCAATGSERVKGIVALTLKFLCAEPGHRKFVVTNGGVRTLLGLVDLEDEPARDAARQALAQICIVTNPTLLPYSEQLDLVRPLVQMLEHKHELLQFEGAMGLTNLLTVGEDLRARALKADAWRLCRDLLFSENEMVQRAGIEAMCNFTMADEVLERFAAGKAELEIRIFIGFCHAEDRATQLAASGALAMLAAYDEVAVQIAANENFDTLLQAVVELTEDAQVQHRVVSAAGAVCEAEGCPPEARAKIKAVLKERRRKGCVSQEAEGIVKALLDDTAVTAGGG